MTHLNDPSVSPDSRLGRAHARPAVVESQLCPLTLPVLSQAVSPAAPWAVAGVPRAV
jgi:hypothetical protein